MSDSRALADALVFPYLNHAASMFDEQYASREDLDNGMRFGCGLPKGPLTVIDELGLETVRDALAARFEQTGDPRHQPSAAIERLIAEGRTGKAAGKGFYTYEGDEVVADELTPAATGQGAARPVKTVGVVGSGTMASGIVEVFAANGFPVTYIARTQDKVDAVAAKIAKNLARQVDKGRLEQGDADAILGRLTGATEREALGDVDIVVEAIAEEIGIKNQLFADLDRICKPGAVLATTTSSLSIADLAAQTKRPQDVVGMHFFNPAPVMKLVEVINHPTTGQDVLDTVLDLCRSTCKVAVSCADRAGFIVNALLFPYLNDAIKAHEEGAEIDTVDGAITEHYGYPMGPFALLDVVGNDVALAIEEELLAEFKHESLTPARLLREVVAAGKLGRKTGEGFRTY
ncbi:3-hydroxyacyl-CoA dehydrogenase NAD-binding domain-containing protein [Janibacter sp. YB324]|uniref:3-hydroxyacyl-CoA dehydrogenase NAD-binding domain-containing protein n=1 Tax=Janibacter sp. YB324 TaxID=2761047 RepID=UPI00162483E7|nr:3-hydroxyacyl-CoA dehydrogenase NAD-binding domain-containing protein [Janibacter sp. YB324]QNF95012.1 3-hydroxyacyl-CoA dehydrogenase [Janibacter sp. YB324]